MRALIVAVVLGVLVWFAYDKFIAGDEAAAPVEQPAANDAAPFAAPEAASTPAPAAEPVATSAPADDELVALDAQWQALLDAGKDPALDGSAPTLLKAYSALLVATYNKPELKSRQEYLLSERLEPLAARVFFSTTPYPDDETGLVVSHQISSGENLNTIGRKYGMSPEFFNVLRGRSGDDLFKDDLRAGGTLKAIKVSGEHPASDWTVGYHYHVDKSDFCLDVFVMGAFVRRFPIGIGTDATPTPTGITFIEARERTPGQWTMPDGTVVYPGDPRFIIGQYWMRMNSQIGAEGIGFHTYTGDGPTTGAKVSNGCVRLEESDIATLYALTTPVGQYESGFITRAPMMVEIVE
ncbi:MAG: L,D-transpeptidase [Planctomycetota bacterium]|jgi:hypothetical protein